MAENMSKLSVMLLELELSFYPYNVQLTRGFQLMPDGRRRPEADYGRPRALGQLEGRLPRLEVKCRCVKPPKIVFLISE